MQFLKSGRWHVGEEDMARRLGVDWWAIGEGFTWDSADLTEDQAVAAEAWRRAAELIAAGEHRLVVLDEITYPMKLGLDRHRRRGRRHPEPPAATSASWPPAADAPAELIEVADTVTEMRNVKHAYDRGIAAKKGIDY